MRTALMSACMLLVSCAAIPPGEGFQSCDMVAAGDFKDRLATSGLHREDVNRAVRVALDAATLTTDPRLSDTTENCRMLMGFRIYTMPDEDFVYPYDGKTWVGGYTVCLFKYIVVGTPRAPRTWANSAAVHEIFHAMQGCEGLPPADTGVPSTGHENWFRDGIFNAIDWAKVQP